MGGWVRQGVRSAGIGAPAVLVLALLAPAVRPADASHALRSSHPSARLLPAIEPTASQARGARDSAEVVADLRRGQRGLERLRMRHMRTVLARSGRCDEIVGRFCLWHEPDHVWEAPPEDPAFVEARARYVARLGEAADALPGDAWIAGQRVRYLLEAGRDEEAIGAARDCRAERPGWCQALAGFALHGAGRHESAEVAFDRSLRAMPPAARCRWTDLEPLLDRRARKAYRDLPCSERAEFEARFWWLADPLYLVPGNERRAEHLWRRVMDRLQEDAASGYGIAWGDDLRELLIRYGWPAGWERARPGPGSLAGGEASTVAHDPPGSRRFVPAGRSMEDPAAIDREEWDLEPPRPRSHYAPGYAREFDPLPVRLARFRRGDTAVVVAVAAAPAETVETGATCVAREVGLFLSAGPRGPAASATSRGGAEEPVSVTARLRVGENGALVSVESLCRGAARAGRTRFGLAPPVGEPAISDLLLGRGARDPVLPADLVEAAADARPPGPLERGERVPLYWEVYGTRGTEAATVSVELARRGGGLFRKLLGWTGLVGDRGALVGLRWVDGRPAPGVWARAVALQIPEDAPEGDYELRVTVRLDGGLPLRTSRRVRVVEPRA